MMKNKQSMLKSQNKKKYNKRDKFHLNSKLNNESLMID